MLDQLFSRILLCTELGKLFCTLWRWLFWALALPSAWDVIQLLCGLSFFGWLAFARLNDAEISRIKPNEKREKARKNLRTINDYFIGSFGFFAIAAFADWALHNTTLLASGILGPLLGHSQEVVMRLVIGVAISSVFGLALLVYPMLTVRGIGQHGKRLEDMNPRPVGAVLITVYPAAINVWLLLAAISTSGRLLIGGWLVWGGILAAFVGTYMTWKYSRDLTSLKPLLPLLLSCTGWLTYMVVIGLHLPLSMTTQTCTVGYVIQAVSNGNATVTTTIATTTLTCT
jgi:hypothetical protein